MLLNYYLTSFSVLDDFVTSLLGTFNIANRLILAESSQSKLSTETSGKPREDWESKVTNIQQQVIKENKCQYLQLNISTSLRAYFDAALPLCLLYDIERDEYEELITGAEGQRPSDVYGAAHLLRLLVTLPSLFRPDNADDDFVSGCKVVFEQLLE